MAGRVLVWPYWFMSKLPFPEKDQSSFRQLSRYAFVGIVSNLAGYLIYLFITHFGIAPKITMTILYVVGAAIGYIGNRNFTFEYQGSRLGSGTRYFIAHFIGYIINLIILFLFVDQMRLAHQWVQAAAIVIVAGFLFIASKFFVFRNPDSLSTDRS